MTPLRFRGPPRERVEDINGFEGFSAEFRRALRRQTCVILVVTAALFTPIYLALFAGLGT